MNYLSNSKTWITYKINPRKGDILHTNDYDLVTDICCRDVLCNSKYICTIKCTFAFNMISLIMFCD